MSAAPLAGKVALVTGTGGGIGQAIGRRLGKAGASVALHYRSCRPDGLTSTLQAEGVKHETFHADLSDMTAARRLAGQVEASLGDIDILVNCAADQRMDDDSDFARLLEVNLLAAETLTRAVAGRGRGGAVVNISSIEAARPAPGHGRYGASKAALEALTKAQASTFGPRGLRVNAVAPGLIARAGIDSDWPEGVARWQAACPLGRLGRPDDIAAAVLFLVSPAAAWITGCVLVVDGGMSAVPGW